MMYRHFYILQSFDCIMASLVNCRDVISFNLKVFSFFGAVPPNFQIISPTAAILYYFRVFFMGFVCVSLIICQTAYLYMTLGGEIHEMARATYLTLTNLLSGIKLYWVYQKRRRIMSLVDTMNETVFQPRNHSQAVVFQQYKRLSKAITVVLIVMANMTIIPMCIFPYTVEEGPFLPLAAHIPYDTSSSPIFEITYAYEVIGIYIGAWAGVNADGLILGFILFICAQLTLLNDSLEHLQEHSLVDSSILDEEMKANLIGCVNQHRHVLTFKTEVSKLFTNITLAQFMISCLTLCTNLFELTMIPINLQFISLVIYMSFLLTEIYCICYYGNEIILKSYQVTSSAYNSDWLERSMEFKKNLIIFMIRSQKDMKYLAGDLFILSLETFVKIVKSSFSYFTVLSQMSQNM